ncbi:hypothetical protein FKG94_05185 [Exilibacterium tricleocarpae]|uniref:Uncharacterized protein n=1 Tax=Exilibacterium tricleocarpae TaxID=2591008 RepID=A0A545U3L5_9GAMM|nr:hypothetical protein FKG94_05185 [Exilibacterium tricleocarpae]
MANPSSNSPQAKKVQSTPANKIPTLQGLSQQLSNPATRSLVQDIAVHSALGVGSVALSENHPNAAAAVSTASSVMGIRSSFKGNMAAGMTRDQSMAYIAPQIAHAGTTAGATAFNAVQQHRQAKEQEQVQEGAAERPQVAETTETRARDEF